MPLKSIACELSKKEFIGISFCKEPEVPILIIFNWVNSFFIALVFKSILTNASNSFKTISILSVPIPVEITVKRLFL